MLETIADFVSKIADFFVSAGQFLIALINDLLEFGRLLLHYFSTFSSVMQSLIPSAFLPIVMTIVIVCVVLRIIGRAK